MWPSKKRPASLETTDRQDTSALTYKKLRSACDRCHQSKMKCSGGMPCSNCFGSGEDCCYSVSNRSGRPKGAKNKRNQEQMSTAQQEECPSISVMSAAHSSKPSQQFSQQIQQPTMPLTPSTYSVSFSPTLSAFWEPLHPDTDNYLNAVQPVASKVIPECVSQVSQLTLLNWSLMTNFHSQNEPKNVSYDTSGLFKSFTMESAEEPLPFLTDQSMYDIRTKSMDQQRPFGSPTVSNTTLSSPESEDSLSDSHLCMPYSASTSRVQTTASLPACSCLEQHFNLLCHLKSPEQQRHTASTLDVILIAVQKSLETWRNVIHCQVCPYDDDQTVLLLSTMTMRSMLGRFQRLCESKDEEHGRSEVPSPAPGTVKLGNYEATKHEQALVTQLLILRALGKIKYALVSLKETVVHAARRQKADTCITDERHEPLARPQVDVEYITQLLQSLNGTVQAVSDAAGTTDDTVVDDIGSGISCPGKQ